MEDLKCPKCKSTNVVVLDRVSQSTMGFVRPDRVKLYCNDCKKNSITNAPAQ